jgi:Hemocyanin, ig-like domain.
LQAENSTNSPKVGTVRIFLAPKFDERGVNFLFRDQRLLFIELDKFTVTCKLGSVFVRVPVTERWFELM